MCNSVAASLLHVHKALGSIPNATKTKLCKVIVRGQRGMEQSAGLTEGLVAAMSPDFPLYSGRPQHKVLKCYCLLP